MKKTFYLFNVSNNLRIYEDYYFNYNLDYITKFNVNREINIKKCNKITLNFGFKHFRFDKKQMVLHFILLELFSNQKCILTTSHKNLILLKLKKGSVTGCKLTIRNENLMYFYDTLILGLPRSEIFKGFFFNIFLNNSNSYSTKLQELFIYQTLALEINYWIKTVDITFNFNSCDNNDKSFFFTYYKIPLKYN